jgi:acyl-CoA thioester hydrolase
MSAFQWSLRVYWEDTDGGGVVYYANYLKFYERARTEWLRARGVEQEALKQHNDLVFAIRAIEVEYLAPARLDDLLKVSVEVLKLDALKFSLRQAVIQETSGRVLSRASVTAVALRASSFKPTRMPPDLLKRIHTA